MDSPVKRSRSRASTPSSGKSTERSALKLMRLQSAEKQRSLQKQIERHEILISSLSRGVSSEESEAWKKVQVLAKQLVDRLEPVPKEIRNIAAEKYHSETNPGWIYNVVSEFVATELKVLMQIYHGKKKDSVASTCALLARITNLPQEKKANPAYVLQHFGLWDWAKGDELEMPISLLDRAKEDHVEFKLGSNLFVAGVVVYGLLKLDMSNKLQELRELQEKDESVLAQQYDYIAEQLESAQKATPRVESKVRVAKKEKSGVEFRAPRKANLSTQLEEASREQNSKGDLGALQDQVESQRILIENLIEENRRMRNELQIGNKKIQDIGSERRVQATSDGEAEDRAEAFAKLATTKLHNTGKIDCNKNNNLLHNVLEDDLSSELDGLSDVSSVGGSEVVSVRKGSPAQQKSSAEESIRNIIFKSTNVTMVKAPGSLAKAVRMFSGSGVFVLDGQGNVFKGTQTAKIKDPKAWDVQFSFELVYPMWASKEEVEHDTTYAGNLRWPQNWPQMKGFLDEQLSMLYRDSSDEETRARALPYYDPKVRCEKVRQFQSCVREIVKSTLGLRDEPKHPRHVQVFALISYFVYLLWTSAMVKNETEVLTADPMGIWIRHFDIKLSAAQGKVDIPMKEAVVWLGYGCKNKCKKGGMCPGFCLYCDADAVVAQIRGTSSKGKVDSTNSRYEVWKKETLKSNASASVTFADFKRHGPKSPKVAAKKESTSPVGEEEYFSFLEENQHYFRLEIPDPDSLNC